MHPDQKYIDALLNSNEKLLYELYKECFPIIRNMILQNNGSEENAADIFQDALVDLLRKVKSEQFYLTSSVCAYIKGICRNKWLDELTKRKRSGVTIGTFTEQDNGEDHFHDYEEGQLQQARLDLIKKKFKELGQSCRDLLKLSWTKNANGKRRSTDEIAEALHVTNGYVRKKKSECIVKLMNLVINDPEFATLKRV